VRPTSSNNTLKIRLSKTHPLTRILGTGEA
jgi:hypothetical protein